MSRDRFPSRPDARAEPDSPSSSHDVVRPSPRLPNPHYADPVQLIQLAGIYERLSRVEGEIGVLKRDSHHLSRRTEKLEESVDAIEDKEANTAVKQIKVEERAKARAMIASHVNVAIKTELLEERKRKQWVRRTIVGAVLTVVVGVVLAVVKIVLLKSK